MANNGITFSWFLFYFSFLEFLIFSRSQTRSLTLRPFHVDCYCFYRSQKEREKMKWKKEEMSKRYFNCGIFAWFPLVLFKYSNTKISVKKELAKNRIYFIHWRVLSVCSVFAFFLSSRLSPNDLCVTTTTLCPNVRTNENDPIDRWSHANNW